MKEKVNLSKVILIIASIMVVSMILLRYAARTLMVIGMLFMQISYSISVAVLIIAVIYLTIQAFKFYLDYKMKKGDS